MIRSLTKEEREFIRNERLLGMLDFSYWTLVCKIIHDKGGIASLVPWGSQLIILDIIAKIEEEMHDRASRNEPIDGILLLVHKARQLGATMLARSLLFHRLTTNDHIRAITASIDDSKIDAIVLRDKRILDNIPWWMKPSVGYDTKGGHLFFDKLDSSLIYQTYQQTSGMGQGEQFELGHLTECASAVQGSMIEHHMFPTIPQSLRALHILESTAQGRGNWWHDLVERVIAGYTRRWRLVFVPWYAEESKYRALPPVNWIPSDLTLLHGQKVWDTSAEYIGKKVMLSKENLYWYETTRNEYAKGNNLALFLTNYCATVEESFQHSASSAFSTEILDHFRNQSRTGVPYEIQSVTSR